MHSISRPLSKIKALSDITNLIQFQCSAELVLHVLQGFKNSILALISRVARIDNYPRSNFFPPMLITSVAEIPVVLTINLSKPKHKVHIL